MSLWAHRATAWKLHAQFGPLNLELTKVTSKKGYTVVPCTLLISALRSQKQVDLCEFKASLVYRVSSRTGFKAT